MREYERARIEYSVDGETRSKLFEEVQEMKKRIKKQKEEYSKDGLKVLYSYCKGTKTSIAITSGPAGYAVRVNGKPVITSRSLDDCAAQAYIAGYIGYFKRIELGMGKAAADRARKDPETLARLKKAGAAANP